MSLLLDARKKLQLMQQDDPASSTTGVGQPESTTEKPAPPTGEQARNTGHNLFAAKSLPAGSRRPNRNLLYALAGTALLLATGLSYLWYENSVGDTPPLRPASAPPPVPPTPQAQPVDVPEPATQEAPTDTTGQSGAETAPGKTPSSSPAAEPPPAAMPQPRNHASAPPDSSPIHVEKPKIEPVDPLLNDAYLAYRSGKLDEARQLYLTMFAKDTRNPDVLLGLAAIAQQRGENQVAAQYFGRVLTLDPRNAAANAGMAALSADDDYDESRLKTLLREQGNSAVLHFALGNLYAGQSRWGEAQQAYFNAYMLEPDNAEHAFNLAVSLDHLGQEKLAAQHYLRAMQLDPSHRAGFDHAQTSQRAQELAR